MSRDIKPENILLDADLNIKLTDFGFSKKVVPGRWLREVCGTPGYLSPEILQCGLDDPTASGDSFKGYRFEVSFCNDSTHYSMMISQIINAPAGGHVGVRRGAVLHAGREHALLEPAAAQDGAPHHQRHLPLRHSHLGPGRNYLEKNYIRFR